MVPSLTNKNLPLDTIEALAWGSNLDWGYDKHPPMSAFFSEVLYQMFGAQDWVYYFLSQLFVVIAFYFVFKFSNEILGDIKLSLISVLLLEAGGPDKNINIHIPGAYLKIHKSKDDWGFWTEKQVNVLNRKIYLPRGKTLGGSSSTNAMAYVRGNPADYDSWAELGNAGWSFKEVLPYFKRSENHEQIDIMDFGYHSNSGELAVTIPTRFKTPYVDGFIDACEAMGIPRNLDYNGLSQKGASLVQSTIKNGKRESGATAFLKPVLNRPNLKTITRARVHKIIFEGKKAVGVQYKKGEKIIHVNAHNEIILSAGAFQSPQLLMLSGIGEPSELKKYSIGCIHELKGVGKNLQDHLFLSLIHISEPTRLLSIAYAGVCV